MKSQYSYIIEFHLLQLRCHALCARAPILQECVCLGFKSGFSHFDINLFDSSNNDFVQCTVYTTQCGFVPIINEKLMMLQNYGKYTLRNSKPFCLLHRSNARPLVLLIHSVHMRFFFLWKFTVNDIWVIFKLTTNGNISMSDILNMTMAIVYGYYECCIQLKACHLIDIRIQSVRSCSCACHCNSNQI